MKWQGGDSKWHACQLEYLNAVLANGDTAALVAALAAVARARLVTRDRDAGLGQLSLYKVLCGSGNPTFATVVGAVAELGYSFSLQLDPGER